MNIPRSTLRLQFNRDFTYDDALAQLDYFAALGVSHLYASPITTAQPGSMHGYDTVDYGAVSTECGGEAGLRRLADALHARDMGLVVDVVPNHMGVGGAHNAWWLDILEWGRHSAFARHFDVDWHSPDPALRGKVLVPFLGAPYGEELAAGRIALRYDRARARLQAEYGPHVCPICPTDYAAILQAAPQPELAELASRFRDLSTQPADQPRATAAREALAEWLGRQEQGGQAMLDALLATYDGTVPAGRERLHRLLERQHFRLAWWRTAADEINWRRFFDISSLAAVRVERPEVFEASHALIFRLYAERVIDGVRIDHVDGLAEPREYCQRLRQRLAELRDDNPWLIVEKILARGEPLREDWPVDGTTGYDFMNDVGALLHDPRGAAPLAAAWAEIDANGTNGTNEASFAQQALMARRMVLATSLAAELDRATRALHRLAREAPATRDFTFTAIRRALTELAVHFPVYRIYPLNGLRSETDERYFGPALEAARRSLPRSDHAVLERVAGWLGGPPDDTENDTAAAAHARRPTPQDGAQPAPQGSPSRRAALTLFSQLTAPLAAKAVEDTACYRYGRLLSRNEVGADPGEFSLTAEAFHAANLARARRFPHALLATATHDHKRGEDVRARLAVLSEIAGDWSAVLRGWSTLNTPLRRAPEGGADGNDGDGGNGAMVGEENWAPGPAAEAMLYQTLVGCWPLGLDTADDAGIAALAERVAAWQLKALREAKLRTSWLAPDEAYEQACRDFLFDIVAPQRRDGFLRELGAFVQRIGAAGALNGLQQTLLRLVSPGVPDLYQGTELWDFSLVDPDNRRPVDFAARRALLAAEPPSVWLPEWRNGRVKLAVIQRGLALRAHLPGVFGAGDYLPLAVRGAHAERVIALARRHERAWVVAIATRLATPLLDADGELPLVRPQKWEDTAVQMPRELAGRALFDWLSPAAPRVGEDGWLPLGDALAALPVALLVEEGVPRAQG